ncbi:MAG: cation diffusion facilitator family transporter [Lachnospiraceae bacterium]|nr:cation diffusion facilitator family transporter [Lachnospiraceae bacterium]
MLTFLIKLLIKNPEDPASRSKYGILCGIYGIFLNFFLFAAKYVIGTLSGAISIVADAFNNLSDAASSVVSVIGIRLSNHAPDLKHPYGHGRIEYLAGLAVSAVIVVVGHNLMVESFHRILNPVDVEFSPALVIVLALSVAVKLYMSAYNRNIGRKIDSLPLMATSVDSLSDSVATGAVLVSAVIAHFTGLRLDGYAGLVVGLLIIIAGIKAAKETVSPLLGQAPDPEFIKKVEEIVGSSSVVVGMHDLIVHDYGPGRVMISLHAEVPGDGNIFELHDEIDLLELKLNRELNCHAVIHMDPVEVGNPVVDALKQMVKETVGGAIKGADIHDFRVSAGPTHKNLIFDVVVPFSVKLKDEEVKDLIQQEVRKKDKTCFTVITVDRDFTGGK